MQTEQQEPGASPDDNDIFTVGKIVQVEARTWPGINKPGGVGRITQLHYSSENVVTSVDVRYTVVGGRERHVPIEHVQAAPEYETHASPQGTTDQQQQRNQALRDRSGLLGRCKRCGSLRADCQSCDWREQERLARNPPEQQATSNIQKRRNTKVKSNKRNVKAREQQESLSSSSSSEDEEEIRADNLRRRRYRKQKAFWLRAFDDSDSPEDQSQTEDESSSDGSDNDPLLARLAELKKRRREDKKRELAEKYQVTSKKKRKRSRRPRQTGLSSLESLTAPPLQESTSRVQAAVPARSRDTDEPESPRAKPPEPKRQQVQVEDVGDSDASSQDSLPPPPDEGPVEETSRMEEDGRQAVEVPDVSLDLEGSGFIQPDGEAAAEHLPRDIFDQTQTIPYKQLPAFFDDLLKELQDEVIPDACVDLSEFQRKTRDARNRNDNDALRRLEEEG